MKNLRLLMLALWLTSVLNVWSAQENGLLVYDEPPGGFVEVLRFTSINPGTAYATVNFPNGQIRHCWNTGMLAEVDYPRGTVDPYDANQQIKQIQTLLATYPQYKYQFRGALAKWQNALVFSKQIKAAHPAAAEAQGTELPTLDVSGTKYENVTLTGVSGSTASITHSDGVGTISLSDLSPSQIRVLNGTTSSVQIDLDWKATLERAEEQRIAEEKRQEEKQEQEEKRHEAQQTEKVENTANNSPTADKADPITDAQNELKQFDELVGRNPLDYRTRDQRGFCQLKLGDILYGSTGSSEHYEEALNDFTVAIQSYPNDANAYAGRAEALLELVRTDDAYADITKALRMDPNNAVAYDALGKYYLTASKEAEAINAFSKAVALDPGLKQAAIMLDKLKKEASNAQSNAIVWKAGSVPEGCDVKVEESRQHAFKLYPALRDPGSRFAQFTAGISGILQSQEPDFFHDPEWPAKLAHASKNVYVEQLHVEAAQLTSPIQSQLDQDSYKLKTLNSLNSTSGVYTSRDKSGFESDINNLIDDINSLRSQLDKINKEYRSEELNPGSTGIDSQPPAPLPNQLPQQTGENSGAGE